MPARQLGGQPDILTALTDRNGQVVVGDDNLHRTIGLVDDDTRDFGGRERIANKFGRIHMPGDNVDLLAPELLNHVLHTAALHPHAGAHRIDIRIVRGNRNFGAHPRFTGSTHDADDAFTDLGDLGFKQIDQKILVRPRQDDLRPTRFVQDVQNIGADPIPPAVGLSRDLFANRQDPFRLA